MQASKQASMQAGGGTAGHSIAQHCTSCQPAASLRSAEQRGEGTPQAAGRLACGFRDGRCAEQPVPPAHELDEVLCRAEAAAAAAAVLVRPGRGVHLEEREAFGSHCAVDVEVHLLALEPQLDPVSVGVREEDARGGPEEQGDPATQHGEVLTREETSAAAAVPVRPFGLVNLEALHAFYRPPAVHVLVNPRFHALQSHGVAVGVHERDGLGRDEASRAGGARRLDLGGGGDGHRHDVHHLLVPVQADGVEAERRLLAALERPDNGRRRPSQRALLVRGVVLRPHLVAARLRVLQQVHLWTVTLREVPGQMAPNRGARIAVVDLVAGRLHDVQVDVRLVRVPAEPHHQPRGEAWGPQARVQGGGPQVRQAML
mmetsp:Transcript_16946/g.53233  ORF Transcript_16946/g.53233 Transcript_16946/m.53233 type:complete len:372 (-) Transcript_16946:2066-3181(-)